MKIGKLAKTEIWPMVGLLILLILPLAAMAQGIFTPPESQDAPDTSIDLAVRLITVLISLVGLLTVFFLYLGITKYAGSAGDGEKVEKSKKMVINSLMTVVTLLLAFALVRVVANAIIP